MPTLDENKQIWDHDLIWECGGEEWSKEWGGPNLQWYGSIMPRIHRFLPANTILEIGPGYGRFTQFLKKYAEELILVDISENGIKACKTIFADEKHIQFYVNDGKSLEMIKDNSIDFIFTHDALVFAEEEVMAEYIHQIANKLTKNGAAFIHHSNLGDYWYFSKLSSKNIKLLQKLKIVENDHWRARSVSAEKIRKISNDSDLETITQELIVYFTEKTFVDCYSVIVNIQSKWYQKPLIYRNSGFMEEAKRLRKLSKYYGLPYEKRYNSPVNNYDEVMQKIKTGEI